MSIVTGTSSNDTLNGTSSDDTLSGGNGDDLLIGYLGNDSLIGGFGQDTYDAGPGNDTIDASAGNILEHGHEWVMPGTGSNTIIGNADLYFAGNGLDLAYGNLSGAGGLTFNIGSNGTGTVVSLATGVVNDTFTYSHFFQGTADADVFIGSDNTGNVFEVFMGLAGADTINGNGGFDVLAYEGDTDFGGVYGIQATFDSGTSGSGFVIDGFGFTDIFNNIESIRGSRLADTINGNNAANKLNGQEGDDSLFGGAGNDTLLGGAGNDQLRADAGDDLVFGDDGNDYITGGAGNDTLNGGAGSDDAVDYYYTNATAGIVANLGIGVVTGGEGTDQLMDIEHINGTDFADSITGNTSRNNLQGQGGNDTIHGGGGEGDWLAGHDGDDLLVNDGGNGGGVAGGRGNDTMHGGSGTNNDVNYGTDDFSGATQGVVVNLSSGIATDSWGYTDILSGFEGVSGSHLGDQISGDDRENHLTGAGGNDTIHGGGGDNDWLDGGDGNDLLVIDSGNGGGIRGGRGDDTMQGGSGDWNNADYWTDSNDTSVTQGVVVNLATGTATDSWGNTDALSGFENVSGSELNDWIQGDGSYNNLVGSGGSDTLIGAGDQGDHLDGGSGADSLVGSSGSDWLHGGSGNDTIDGGSGSNQWGPLQDHLDYAAWDQNDLVATQGVVVNLLTGTATDNWGNQDTLLNIENVGGSSLDDYLTGNQAENRLIGEAGNDAIHGGGGDNDWLDGGDGNDLLVNDGGNGGGIRGGRGDDTMQGGSGDWNNADYWTNTDDTTVTQGAVVNLATGTATDSWGNTDTLSGFENVSGSHLGDTLTGDSGRNHLHGNGGNDTLDGGAGDDSAGFNGNLQDYSFAVSNGVITVTDNNLVNGDDGIDTLSNIERLNFNNGSINATSLSGFTGVAVHGTSNSNTGYWTGPDYYWQNSGSTIGYQRSHNNLFYQAEVGLAGGVHSLIVTPDLVNASLNGVQLQWEFGFNPVDPSTGEFSSLTAPRVGFGSSFTAFDVDAWGGTFHISSVEQSIGGQTVQGVRVDLVNGGSYDPLIANALMSNFMGDHIHVVYPAGVTQPTHNLVVNVGVQISSDGTTWSGAQTGQVGTLDLHLYNTSPSPTSVLFDGNLVVISLDNGNGINKDFGDPNLAYFQVMADGSSVTVTNTTLLGNKLILTLGQNLASTASVAVTYNDPTNNQVTGVLQAWNGTDVASFSLNAQHDAVASAYAFNLIIGTPGNDNLVGTAGADRFELNGGADIVDGGAGIDEVVIGANATQSTWSFTDTGAIVNGTTYANIEAIKFDDQLVARFGGHTYYGFGNINNLIDAQALAASLGGYIVSIGSDAENNFVIDLMRLNYATSLALGASDSAQEGKWVWDDGTLVTYADWGKNEPNDYNGAEDSARIESGNWLNGAGDIAGWNDSSGFPGGGVLIEVGAGNTSGSVSGTNGNESLSAPTSGGGVQGLAGNDTIAGSAYRDVLYGDEGDDYLSGLAGNDSLSGWDGTDTLVGGEGNDTLLGGASDDSLDGGSGTDSLLGGSGNDTLVGGTGRDTLFGGDGNDYIDASAGDASTEGNGDYVRPGAGSNTIMGSATLFAGNKEAIDISYRDVAGSGGLTVTVGENGLDGTVVSKVFGVVNDTFSYAHWFQGTNDADSFVGSGNTNWEGFSGLAGNDTINGGTGFDEVIYSDDFGMGGTQGVTVNFETNSAIDGFGHTDSLLNIDAVRGTRLADVFVGSSALSFARYRGLAGNDTLQGSSATDQADYKNDADEGGTGAVFVNLQEGIATDGFGNTDTLMQIDWVRGTAFADTFIGDDDGNKFEGLDGDDVLIGGTGSDTLVGGSGNDILDGAGHIPLGLSAFFDGVYDHVIYSDATSAVVVNLATGTATGGGGNDTLSSINSVIGSTYSDTLTGGSSTDLLQGNSGDDSIDGGDGTDIARYFDATGAVQVNLALGIATGADGNDTLINIEGVFGGAYSDSITGGETSDVFMGRGGDDTIDGAGGSDMIMYTKAESAVYVNLASGIATGGEGNDRLISIERVRGSVFNDSLIGSDADNELHGRAGDDSISSSAGDDILSGGQGNDTIDGGLGVDTAMYQGNSGEYSVHDNGNGTWTVTDRVADRDGIDNLSNIESLTFIDQTMAIAEMSSLATTVKVNPAGTWLADVPNDAAPAATEIALSAVGASAGSILALTQLGDYQAGIGIKQSTGLPFTDSGTKMLAVFVNASGGYVSPSVFLSYTSPVQSSSLATDISNDFFIASGMTEVVVPNGAVAIRFSVDDIYFNDNNDPDQDFSVLVRTLPAYVTTDNNDGLFGTGNADTLSGGSGNDSLKGGGDGSDSLVGGLGQDSLYGDSGNDVLDGAAGDASTEGNGDYIRPGAGTNTILGSAAAFSGHKGLDISYRDVTGSGGLTFNVGDDGAEGTVTSKTAGIVNDTFTYGDWFQGSSAADIFNGSNNSYWEGFSGLAGNDTIDGDTGWDEVFYDKDYDQGGTAAVTINLATGLATDGFGNTDTLINIDAVRGTKLADTFTGSASISSVVSFSGMQGNDTLRGSTSSDRADYSNDATNGGLAGVFVNLEAGTATDGFGDTDTLIEIDQVRGTAYADTLIGNSGDNKLEGKDGDDVLIGGMGRDTLIGGLGNDILYGGGHNNAITSYENNEFDIVSFESASTAVTVDLQIEIAYGEGNDTLSGIDYIVGSTYSDLIYGSNQNITEQFRGGLGDDTIDGRDGFDFANYFSASGAVQVDLVAGTSSGADGHDTLINIEGISGSSSNDSLRGDDARNWFVGNAGDDTIDGRGGQDMVGYHNAPSGVSVNLALGTATGGEDNDTLISIEDVRGSDFSDSIVGSSLGNWIQARSGNDTVSTAAGDDTLSGGYGSDSLDGGTGFDIAQYLGNQNDYTVTALGDGRYTVTDAVADRDGTDTLTGIEQLQFADNVQSLEVPATNVVGSIQTYDWKHHVVLGNSQVGFVQGDATIANSDQLFDLRNAKYDIATGKYTVDIWANASTDLVVETFGMGVHGTGTTSVSISTPLSSWSPIGNLEGATDANVAGVNLTGVSAPTKMATVTAFAANPSQGLSLTFDQLDLSTSYTDRKPAAVSSSAYAAQTDSNGSMTLAVTAQTNVVMTVDHSTAGISTAQVSLGDAVSVLKMIVGLDVNGTGIPLKPFQAYAADFDGNGTVNLSDAIGILKYVVGLTSPQPDWVFVDPLSAKLPGIQAQPLSPGQPDPIHFVTGTADAPALAGLVGVLRGDVNGSYGSTLNNIPASDLDLINPGYFDDLAAKLTQANIIYAT